MGQKKEVGICKPRRELAANPWKVSNNLETGIVVLHKQDTPLESLSEGVTYEESVRNFFYSLLD
jgi:hypothetical protein